MKQSEQFIEKKPKGAPLAGTHRIQFARFGDNRSSLFSKLRKGIYSSLIGQIFIPKNMNNPSLAHGILASAIALIVESVCLQQFGAPLLQAILTPVFGPERHILKWLHRPVAGRLDLLQTLPTGRGQCSGDGIEPAGGGFFRRPA